MAGLQTPDADVLLMALASHELRSALLRLLTEGADAQIQMVAGAVAAPARHVVRSGRRLARRADALTAVAVKR